MTAQRGAVAGPVLTAAELPEVVTEASSRFLTLVDEALPGEVLGFYLTGSVPLGDFHPGSSDIDGTAVLAKPLTDPERVRGVFEAMPKTPSFDVTYLTFDELALPPDPTRTVVFTQTGELLTRPGGPISPVLWSELARQSIAIREAPGLRVHDDQHALEQFTRDNLTSYWTPKLAELETAIAERPGDEVTPDWIVPWFVLGIPRLHALLTTGKIVSKSAAGHHALHHWPQTASLISRALAARAGSPEAFTVADARETVTVGRAVIADALRGN
ncbi:aminoglycoside adenylyltransferase domain-containing protein [Kribbella sp. CA-253562]|uniref:aminoglycoside adenylyltransferase domain-containing protein n=1 Tax=Kribbella sp. CA-253562 TaxID=3239942 RepID=UPI003D8D3E92